MTDTLETSRAMGPPDAEAFKCALRRWASGVTVVTAAEDGELYGMTVSAFSSVSAEPPLVLVCANQGSRTHAAISRAGAFAVNILSRDQEALSGRFASTQLEGSRFDGVPYRLGARGVPLLDGALAAIECVLASAHAEGSHTIYIGRVSACHLRDTEPLVYFDGRYRSIT